MGADRTAQTKALEFLDRPEVEVSSGAGRVLANDHFLEFH
jgi:hypothetical protein